MNIDEQTPHDVVVRDGVCLRLSFRGRKLYTVITPKSIDLSIMQTTPDDVSTLVVMDTIAKLITVALKHGVSPEDISGAIWEASRATTDLAGQLSAAISEHIK